MIRFVCILLISISLAKKSLSQKESTARYLDSIIYTYLETNVSTSKVLCDSSGKLYKRKNIVTWVGYSFNESGDVIKLIKEEIGRSHTRQITYYLLNNKIVKIYYELQYGISRNNGGMIYFDNNKIIKNGAWGEPTNTYVLLRQGYKLLKRKPQTITTL